MSWIWVFIGGGLGSLSRFGLSNWFKTNEGMMPMGTLISNLIATAILGFAVFHLSSKMEQSSLKLFLLTGFCGGFSTFSTFSMETFQLLQTNWLWAIANVLISVVGGLLILWVLSQKY